MHRSSTDAANTARMTDTTIAKPAVSANIAARIERLPLAGFHRRFVGLIALGAWFDIFDIFMMTYLGATLQQSGFLSVSDFSHVIAGGFFGMFVGTVLFGMLSDKLGRKTAFIYMLLIYSFFTLCGAFAPNVNWLIVARTCAGIGIGAELVIIDTYVTEMLPSHARGRYVAITQAIGFTAIPVAALLSRVLTPTHWLLEGWRWVMICGSAGAFFTWLLRLRLPESPRWCAIAGQHERAELLMHTIEANIERELGRPLPPPQARTAESTQTLPIKELFSAEYRGRTLMLIVFHFLQTIGIYGFANWAPTFMLAQGKTLSQALNYSAIIALVSPIGPLLCVWTTERLERKWAIVGLAILMALSGMAFPFARNGMQIVCVGALLTVFSYWFSAVLHAYQAELFPTRARATGVGFTYSWSRLSAVLSTLIIAALLQRGVSVVFTFMAAAMLGVALLVGVLGPKTNSIVLEDLSR
jgi:MFS transporter, putative metabolite:H+ symporter